MILYYQCKYNMNIIECSICLEAYDQTSIIPYICNPCGHSFCKMCLDNRNKYNYYCPICKIRIISIIINRDLCKFDFRYIEDSNESISKIKNENIKQECLLILENYIASNCNSKGDSKKMIDLQSYFQYIKQCCEYIENIPIDSIKLDCYTILHLQIYNYLNLDTLSNDNKSKFVILQKWFIHIKQSCDYIEKIPEDTIKNECIKILQTKISNEYNVKPIYKTNKIIEYQKPKTFCCLLM